MELDCQTCGACCCNPAENRAEGYRDYVEVRRGEPLLKRRELLKRFTVLNAQAERHLLLKGDDERCAALQGALGKKVSCQIYELRPSGCHKVVAGGKRCLQYRRERGLLALQA